MASLGTTLCVVNSSGQDITNIAVSGVDNYDWDGTARPDHNFRGASIRKNDSRCEHQETNPFAHSAPFNMTLTFADDTTLSFRADQRDAVEKHNRFIPASGSASATLRLHQTTGSTSNAIHVQTIRPPDNSGWMGALLSRRPDVRINQITMPGSHDAGMYRTERDTLFCSPEWAQTQTLSILEQLRAGSRYFDLRVYYHNEKPHVGHFSSSQGAMGPALSEILKDVHDFITGPDAANETVFLKFSHTLNGIVPNFVPKILPQRYETEYQATYKSYVGILAHEIMGQITQTLDSVLYKTTEADTILAELPLSTLAGKVCVVVESEFTAWIDPAAGIFRYTDIPSEGGTGDTPGLDVYDCYADSKEFGRMRDDQLAKLGKFGGYDKPYLFLLSWTLTGGRGLLDVEVMANLANPWLPRFMAAMRADTAKPKPNIVYFDCVTPYLCSCVIDVNA